MKIIREMLYSLSFGLCGVFGSVDRLDRLIFSDVGIGGKFETGVEFRIDFFCAIG